MPRKLPLCRLKKWLDGNIAAIWFWANFRERGRVNKILEVNRQFDLLVSRIPIGVYILRTTEAGIYSLDYASPRFAEMFGKTVEEIVKDQSVVFKTVFPEDRTEFVALNLHCQTKILTFDWTGRFLINGELRWRHLHSVPERCENGDILWHGILEDVTERKLLEQQIESLANHDSLTKLPNRRMLLDRLTFAMALSKRTRHYAALIFLDMDRFKELNDNYGHQTGDQMLIEVASRLSGCIRETDTAARFGGDEFVVLLGDLDADRDSSVVRATRLGEEIRQALCEPYYLTDVNGSVFEYRSAASIGVTVFFDHITPLETIIAQADTAMYDAKSLGRNMVKLYSK